MKRKIEGILNETKKVIIGKDEILEKVLISILAEGHILLEDIPGVGKTTLSLAFSKALGLDFRRIQFTPDVMPSDVVGFSMYDKKSGEFQYKEGAVMTNLLLADEINRTSSKTQSALLEVMEESRVTVDARTYALPSPFIVIATQNPIGSAGTQLLPQSQLDRFMVCLSMGYPNMEAQINILKDRQTSQPLDHIQQIVTKEEIIKLQEEAKQVHVSDKILEYIIRLVEGTRNHDYIKLGVSPRGAFAINRFAKVIAYITGRDYVIPEDVVKCFADICGHRILLNSKAKIANKDSRKILEEILEQIESPDTI